jgi:signal transduction histidine kinase
MPLSAVPQNVPRKRLRNSAQLRDATSKRSLVRAFQSFTQAADSLEKSYGHLQAEVLRLRFELERVNHDLAASLEDNSRMRGYLTRVIEGMPCGLLVVDRRGELRMTNGEARRLLSNAASENADLGERTASAPIAPAALRQFIAESRESSARREWEWTPEGSESATTIGLACAVIGETDGDGSTSESIFLLRDVTKDKNQAQALETARRRESLAEMAALLAHEIRNPLGSLELFAGLLADAANSQPELRRWTDHVQAGLRSLSATVNNVLQFHSQPSPQLCAVNLGRLLRESVDFLRPLARQAGLKIDFQNSLGELEIAADAHRLQQVFFNLALNAFRAMSVNGMLSVRLNWADFDRLDEVRIDFEDSGCGIAAEHLEKIFESGFTTTAGNPGLGLTVCLAVVEQHGGRISTKSEIGRGTTFRVILPRGGGIA